MSEFDVVIRQVTKEFGGRRGAPVVKAVDDITIEIQRGEFFALLGPSGCGKTTTLRMIAGFERPTSGEILIGGKAMQHVPPFHRPVNTVFQDYALFPHMTALQNVMFGLEMAGLKKSECEARARDALKMVQLSAAENRKPKALSGGQQQRVALARALVKNPTVLLLDEPLGALDLKLRKEMQLELKQIQQDVGITFVYVTHDQEEALTMADRIAVMEGGHVLQIGAPQEIYDKPNTRFVADFIGETNFIVGELTEQAGNRAFIELGGHKLGAVLDDAEVAVGQRATVAIRPEKIHLIPSEGDFRPADEVDAAPVEQVLQRIKDDPDSTVITGYIQRSIYIGTDTRYIVTLDNSEAEIVIRSQNFETNQAAAFTEGQKVYLHWVDANARILRD